MDRLGKGMVHDGGCIWPHAPWRQSFPIAIPRGHKLGILLFHLRLSKEAIHLTKGISKKVFLLSDYTLFYLQCHLLSLLDWKDLYWTRRIPNIHRLPKAYHRHITWTTGFQFFLPIKWRHMVLVISIYHALDNRCLQSPKEWKGLDVGHIHHCNDPIWSQ